MKIYLFLLLLPVCANAAQYTLINETGKPLFISYMSGTIGASAIRDLSTITYAEFTTEPNIPFKFKLMSNGRLIMKNPNLSDAILVKIEGNPNWYRFDAVLSNISKKLFCEAKLKYKNNQIIIDDLNCKKEGPIEEDWVYLGSEETIKKIS